MRSSQVIRELETRQEKDLEFIKWWRVENDFADFELVDTFIRNADSSHVIADFELLDKEQMWQILKRWKPSGLKRLKSAKSEIIEWQHITKEGLRHTYTCPYNARSIMSIFDAETGGDTIV